MELLIERSGNACELCKSVGNLSVYTVPPDGYANNHILVCDACNTQLDSPVTDAQYWRFLTDTMWSEVPAVQVLSWRILSRLKNEGWAADNLDMLYLDEETLAWAKAVDNEDDTTVNEVHKDSIGAILENGDTVVLTRSLDIKGSPMNAKMGTVVKNIKLVADNTDQVEGKINNQMIVILTKYLRKQNG
ncbi:PhnA domain-containing protein [Mucilaginibacter terrae]|uniref:Protein PhnA n=1 Tax=Mucilaginibacter terrae TaxID=1955052 RepID=A0ABU3GTV5_9SPHI|nr:PhnA domain-containing protein [Mucilaginibacter terrae]MDT3403208.1 protein PhnA [Mucilaginibacter terrae]